MSMSSLRFAVPLFGFFAFLGTTPGHTEDAQLFYDEEIAVDCFDPKAGVESLVCSDPVLADLDRALGKAVIAENMSRDEHRTWFEKQTSFCSVPDAETFSSPSIETRAVHCLIRAYLRRLRDLNHPKVLPASALKPTQIHPLCVVADSGLFDEKSRSVPLAACRAARAHIPVERDKTGLLSANGMDAGAQTWVAYRVIGSLPSDEGLGILAYYNGGGSGVFSTVASMRRQGREASEQLVLTRMAEGGDRCNGGIADAVIEKDRLRLDLFVTPADLAALLPGLSDESLTNGLSMCAACCLPTKLRIEQSLPENASAPKILGLFADARDFKEDAGSPWDSPADQCLQSALQKEFRNGASELPASRFEAVVQRYRTCLEDVL